MKTWPCLRDNMHTVHILLMTLAVTTQAHMSLWYPPPLGGSLEANPLTTQVDNELNFPIGCCDSDGKPTLPSLGDCRGHLHLLDTEEGRPQVTWVPGEDAYFQLSDHMYTIGTPGSTHYGGSCQVGFSVDKGRSWKVAASYHGNCPHRQELDPQTFHFKVPLNMPSGPAVFAWIWLNREHESFMNCAAVQISSRSSSSIMPILSKSSADSTVYLTTLPSPTSQNLGEGQPHESDCDEDLVVRSGWREPDVTRSRREHAKHRHSRKHYKYYYLSRRSHRHFSSREQSRRPAMFTSDACDWNTAARMETSYYSIDASCAPGAKRNNPKSDDFEIGWGDTCGVVNGDGAYTIQIIEC